MADEAPETPAAGSPPAKKKTNLVPLLIVIGVIVVVIIGVGVWKLTGDDEAAKPERSAAAPRVQEPVRRLAGRRSQHGGQERHRGRRHPDLRHPGERGRGARVRWLHARRRNLQLPKVCVFTRPGGELTMTVNLVGDKRTVNKVKVGPAGLPPDTAG